MKWIITLLICLASLKTGIAQPLPQLLFQHLTGSNGLSNPNISNIFKDSYGLLWIGSESGLTCFDGNFCKRYVHNPQDSSTICANYIVHIIEDKNHDLWIGTQNGLAKYNRLHDNFTNYKSFNSDARIAPNFYSYPFFIDDEQFLWANLSGAIFKLNTKQRTAIHISDKTNGRQWAFQPFYTPLNFYFANDGLGLHLNTLTNQKVKSQHFFDIKSNLPSQINDIFKLNDTTIYICSNAGLITLNPLTEHYSVISDYETSKNIVPKSIAPIPSMPALFLIATATDGLLVFDANKQCFVQNFIADEQNPYSLSKNELEKVIVDSLGNVFVAIKGLGLDYTNLSLSQFKKYFSKTIALKNGQNNNVTAISTSKDGAFIILGTESSGITVMNGQKEAITQVLLSKKGIKSLTLLDAERFLVLSEENEFYILRNKEGHFSVKPLSVVYHNMQVKDIVYNDINLQNGRLLAATTLGLLHIAFTNETLDITPIISINSQVEWSHFQKIIPISKTDFLIQSFYTNIYLIHQNDTGYIVVKEIIRAPFKTNGFYTHKESTYLATTSGLWRYDHNSFSLIPLALANAYCTGVKSVDGNILWIASTNGLLAYNVEKDIAHTYSENEGLQSNIFNENAITITPDGYILAGGNNGFNIFNPKNILTTQSLYNVVISELQVNDKPNRAKENPLTLTELKLNYKENTLAFIIAPLVYAGAAQQQVHYKLEGYEQEWVVAKGRWTVRYPQLPPGDYSFMVYGNNPSHIRKILITITPPYWNTWWFRITGLLIIVGCVVLYVRLRINAAQNQQQQRVRWMLQSQESERKRIASELHDDFGARLSTLKIYLNTFSKNANPKSKEITQHASQMVDDTIHELRNILMNLSPKALEEHGLAAAIHDMAANINKLLPIICSIDTQRFSSKLKKEVQYSLYRICQELINNTLKHANATHIFISLVTHSDKLIFLYEDDGQGFNPEIVRKGYGWNNLKMHAQAIKGVLVIDSASQKGCAVTIEINLHK